jgi:exodeoxyribonuclease VII large subunit
LKANVEDASSFRNAPWMSRPGEASSAPVIPVSTLVGSARRLLEREIGLNWVSGEISNVTHAASGHVYFKLKDAGAQVQCVLYRAKARFLAFPLRNGLAVEVRAVASLYEPRGEFQLCVETMRHAGVGALYERFLRVKSKLAAAGWFDDGRKRALPAFPRAVGIVTSPRGAALHDIVTTLARRWPALRIVVYPAAVQGEGAAAGLAHAIRVANGRAEVDLLIVARGGGSLEDLWAFNEEIVADAIHDSALPVVSGVGHETDFTICDFVADVRAPTPTAAAMLVAPDGAALARSVAALAARWRREGARALDARAQRVDGASRRLVHPAAKLARQARDAGALSRRLARALGHQVASLASRTDRCAERLRRRARQPMAQRTRVVQSQQALVRCARAAIERRARSLAALAQNLAHLNPTAVLERGYAIVADADGRIVADSAQVDVGDDVTLTFARGGAAAKLTSKR